MHKPGRNDPCSCGSGKKFKKCCEAKAVHKAINATPITETPSSMGKVKSLFERNVTAHPIQEPSLPKHEPEDKDVNPIL